MQLDLQLADWQGLSNKVVSCPTGSEVHRGLGGRHGTRLGLIEVEEGREGSKLCAFNVDFKDINEIVTIVFHELPQAPHLNVHVGLVAVDGAKCPGLEVGPVRVRLKFRTPLSKKTVRVSIVAGPTAGKLARRLTLLTLKSYPQTSHPGAFSKSSASKEDSPLMPKPRADKWIRT